jgi:hypothetical protein|tara:strand:+ start:482 stop:598 length:117 start_codon:yes stop_codon:yes gene_type:complete
MGMSDFMSEVLEGTKNSASYIGKGTGSLFESIGSAFWK